MKIKILSSSHSLRSESSMCIENKYHESLALGVKVFSSHRCFSVGEGVVGKGVGRKTIWEKHIEVDFKKCKYYTAYYKNIQ